MVTNQQDQQTKVSYTVKKITSVFAKMVLIFFFLSPLSTIATLYECHYHGDLIIYNNTPFTLAITDDYMALKYGDEGDEKGEFVFDEYFRKDQGLRLLPGDEYYIGHGKSYDLVYVEGYLTFKILHTDKSFVAHYHFAEVWDTEGSWVKLEQPENGQPYAGVSISMVHTSKKMVSARIIHHNHTYALSFTTSDSDAVCIMEPDCTFHNLNLPLTIYNFHSDYVPTYKEKLYARTMKFEADYL